MGGHPDVPAILCADQAAAFSAFSAAKKKSRELRAPDDVSSATLRQRSLEKSASGKRGRIKVDSNLPCVQLFFACCASLFLFDCSRLGTFVCEASMLCTMPVLFLLHLTNDYVLSFLLSEHSTLNALVACLVTYYCRI